MTPFFFNPYVEPPAISQYRIQAMGELKNL